MDGTAETLRGDDTAVLLMAYGGPSSLEDVEPFLHDIRGGRPTSAELVEEIRGRYAAIGGRSPLLEITRAQAGALAERLGLPVYVGMRHWHPYVREVVPEIARAAPRRLVALCLAPHYSRMSIGAYHRALDEALAEAQAATGWRPEVVKVDSFHLHPRFVEAVAGKVREGLARFEEPAQVLTIFTAHSLPERILAEGDPYERQVEESARAVAAQIPGLDWTRCWQSAGASGGPWLGPPLEEVVREQAAAGRKDLLVCPVGFVTDHVEVLYDVDIEANAIARAAGARLERTGSLNTDPGFIEALAEVISEAV